MVRIEIRDNVNSHLGTLDVSDSPDFPLALTYSIAQIMEITPRAGSWSKQFDIPATANNNEVLNRVFDTNEVDTENTLIEKPAIIFSDGIVCLEGLLRIEAVGGYTYPLKYRAQMRGDNIVWVEKLKEKTLRDLSWGSVVWTTANAKTQWAAYEANTEDVVFPVINYGGFSGVNNSGTRFVRLEDLRPAVRVKAVLEQSLNQEGFTMVSDFFDGNNSKLDGRRLTLPFVGEGWAIDEAAKTAAEFVAEASVNHDHFNLTNNNFGISNQQVIFTYGSIGQQLPSTMTGHKIAVFDNETTASAFYNSATGIFSGFSGRVKFSGSVTIDYQQTNLVTNYMLFFGLVKEDAVGTKTLLTPLIDKSLGSFFGGFPNDPTTFDFGTAGGLPSATVNLVATDQVYFMAFLYRDNQAHGAATLVDIRYHAADFLFDEVSYAITRGQTITIADKLPDLSIMDIISGLKHLFNLYFMTDLKTRTVYIEPGDDFFNTKINALDWTEKLDIQNMEVSFPVDKKRNQLFQYLQDSSDGDVEERDKWAKDFYGTLDYRLMSGLTTLGNKFDIGTDEVNNEVFAPTYWINNDGYHFFSGGSPKRVPTIARMWHEPGTVSNQPETYHDFAPRCLYFIYGANGGGMRWDDGTGLDWTNETDIPVVHPGHEQYAHTLGFQNLAFKQDLDLNGNVVDGLLFNFYKQTINTIIRGQRLTSDFNITTNDIVKLDWRKLIYIDRPSEVKGYWILEEISDFSPEVGRLTRVQLLRFEEFSPIEYSGEGRKDPEQWPGIHRNLKVTQGVGLSDVETGEGSYQLGNANSTLANRGNVTVGHGNVNNGVRQSQVGQFSRPVEEAQVIIGAGESEDVRRNSTLVRQSDGITHYGGEVLMECGDCLVNMYIEVDGKYQKMYYDDSLPDSGAE